MADYSFCPKCGAVIPDKHSFCSYCGNRKQYPVLSIYEDRFEVNIWEYAQPDPIQSWGQEQKMQLFHAIADMIGDGMTIPTKQTITIPSSLS